MKLFTLFSQTVNVLLFDGSPDESISGRAYRLGVLGGDPRWLRTSRTIDRLFFWDTEHTRKAHESDIAFAMMILGIEP